MHLDWFFFLFQTPCYQSIKQIPECVNLPCTFYLHFHCCKVKDLPRCWIKKTTMQVSDPLMPISTPTWAITFEDLNTWPPVLFMAPQLISSLWYLSFKSVDFFTSPQASKECLFRFCMIMFFLFIYPMCFVFDRHLASSLWPITLPLAMFALTLYLCNWWSPKCSNPLKPSIMFLSCSSFCNLRSDKWLAIW